MIPNEQEEEQNVRKEGCIRILPLSIYLCFMRLRRLQRLHEWAWTSRDKSVNSVRHQCLCIRLGRKRSEDTLRRNETFIMHLHFVLLSLSNASRRTCHPSFEWTSCLSHSSGVTIRNESMNIGINQSIEQTINQSIHKMKPTFRCDDQAMYADGR